MTAVIFKFQKPDGAPVVGAPFTVALRKPSFDEALDEGILLPGTVEGVTDAQGECTLTLVPGYGVYYLSMLVPGEQETPEGCMPGFHYKFLVPDSAVVLRIEDLIVSTPTWSRPWDEQALAIITEAKIASQEAAANSEASSQSSAVSAQAAQGSAASAAQQASNANTSAIAAAGSASAANTSKNAAAGSATQAAGSATNAQTSATNASNSATAASQSATASAQSAATAASAGATAGTTAGTAAANAVVANKQDKHVNLTAFSGLAGANGRVPVFTAAGAMTTVDITAPLDPKTFILPGTSLTRVAEAVHAALSGYGFYTNDGTINIDNLPGGWCGLVSTGLGGVMPPLAGGFFWLSCQQTYSGQSQLQTAVQYGGSATDPNSVSLHPGIAIRIRNQLGTAWGPWGKTLNTRDIVASNLDQTVGKVLTVGYQGLGSDAAPALVDMNQPFGSGFSWATSGTSNPWAGFASGSNFITSSASTSEVAQIGFSRSTPLRVAARRKTSGNWQALVEFIHTGNMTNDPALNTGGILNTTTVSGVFVSKFLGGSLTMVGTGTTTASVAANAIVTVDITVPSGFLSVNTAVPLVSAVGSVNNDFYAPAAYMVNGVTLRVTIRNGATAQTFTPRFYIAGRWSA